MIHIDKDQNTSIEFHDSEASGISPEGANLSINFAPAIVHRSDRVPGVDPGTCWTQEAMLVLVNACLSGASPQLPCSLFGGRVILGDRAHDNTLPAPLAYSGDVVVDLVFEDGSAIHATADGLRLELIGSPVFLEEFPG